MNPLIVRNFNPNANITIYGTNGDVVTSGDLIPSAVQLQITRSIDGNPGQFTLILMASKKNNKTWQDRIHTMDYIEIRVGNKNDLHMRLRGFIDSVSENCIFPTSGGPQRGVMVTGRDYTKLFVDQNIQYLWQSMVSGSGDIIPGLNMNYGIPMMDFYSIGEMFKLLVDSIYNGKSGSGYAFIPNFNRVSKAKIPTIGLGIRVPDKYRTTTATIQPYTGAFWNLLTYYSSAPLGEVFITDTDVGPLLACRVVPFKDVNGNYPSITEKPFMPDIELDASVISGYNVGKFDGQVFNYFFVYPDNSSDTTSAAPMYVTPSILNNSLYANVYQQNSPNSNPAWISKSVDLYGFRPLNIPTPWLTPADVNQTDTVQIASELSSFAAAVYGHNEDFDSGTITCHGDASFIPGRNVIYNKTSFYLEKTLETFDFIGSSNPTWNAIMTVTRGQPT